MVYCDQTQEHYMHKSDNPTVYVIAGPNGAGKTTFASEFLPSFVQCREFLNADLIAAGLSPFSPESQALRAGRLLLIRMSELLVAKENFSFETTLAGRGYMRLFKEMKTQGYRIVLFFLWLPSAELAVARVHSRVMRGGHAIPEDVIHRRFHAGLRNLFTLYKPLVDVLRVYNASNLPPEVIMHEENGEITIYDNDIFQNVNCGSR